jgi:hypothetical protein
MSTAQKGFARHASGIQAIASHFVFFDEGNLRSQGNSAGRDNQSSAPGAQHNNMIIVAHLYLLAGHSDF